MLSYFHLDGVIIKGDDTDMVFKEGTTAFIVESNRIIREVIIVKRMILSILVYTFFSRMFDLCCLL